MTASSSSEAGDLEKQPLPTETAPPRNHHLDETKEYSVDDDDDAKTTKRDGIARRGSRASSGRGRGLASLHSSRSSSSEGDGEAGDEDEVEVEEVIGEEHPSVLDRVLSRVTSKSSYDPGPPPDGGWLAWTQCLVGHIVIFNTWGWVNSFGTFQTYYTELLQRPPSDVSWIGSLNVFLLFFVGTLTGRLVDAGYFRLVFLTGTALLAVGIFTISACTTYWQFLLAQGLCLGIAHGCLFCPTLAVLSTYFLRRRALALGVAACGSATGGLVFPSMVRQLLPQVGFPWTVRAIGFVQLATMVVANLLARPRIKPRRAGPLVEWSAFGELEYTFYAAGAFFNFWGVYFAFFYVAAFSREALRPPMSYPDSLNLLLLLNGIGTVGRLVPNYVADHVGAVNVFIPTSIVASALVFCWVAIDTPAGMYAWVVFYGIAAAGIQSLFPAALSFLTTDLRKLGVRMGMVFTIVSFAVLTGPPIAGAIINGPGGYTGARAFAGSSIAVGCGFLVAAKVTKMRKAGQGWRGRI
ncbi:MFS monocarboxylate transporter [Purpureocillium lilacinum]|uniref:MFS monocarboxylate transporter n=1 Tax=Purpureocillium lilacinum TaxID=33203 RepID=A0A2U3EPC1_PURLI|nr:MFS monocarboxylate transporter [Purpureocillium lilacinum]